MDNPVNSILPNIENVTPYENGEQTPETIRIEEQSREFDALQILRKAGYAKPDGVSTGQWFGLKKLMHKHEYIALRLVSGENARIISREMGYTEGRMSIIVNSPRMKARVEELRSHYYGTSVQGRFSAMLPKAVQVIDDILTNPQERSNIKLKAANELLNRAIGKPKETIEIRSNTAKDIFEYLDQKRAEQKVLDGTPVPIQSQLQTSMNSDQKSEQGSMESPDTKSVFVETEQNLEIDAWAEKNLRPLVKENI